MTGERAHGQAMTELMLGLLVFVTVLLFGIHFAELGFLSTKVHEAQAAALWDSTAYRSYQFGVWSDSSRIAAVGAQVNAGNRYADWDGRSSVTNTFPTLALTKAEPMTINCQGNPGVQYPLALLAPSFGEAGGVSCGAEGDTNGFRIPNAFAEGANGFFRASHSPRPNNPMHVCGSGRPSGNTCPGQLAVLLGDYALTDNSEARECELATSSPAGCTNGNFYSLTKRTFDKSMRLTAGWAEGWTGRPEAWTRNIVSGVPGGRVTGFFLSFRGEESSFVEPVEAGINGGTWQTNPMDAWLPRTPYRTAYTARRACALGAGYCFLGRYPCN